MKSQLRAKEIPLQTHVAGAGAPSQETHLATDVFVDQDVLPFVVEDHVHFFGAWATDVRAWIGNKPQFRGANSACIRRG